MVAGQGILRNFGRNNNSPGTGARYLLVCGRCALNRDNRVRLVPALGTDCAVLKQDKAKPFLVTSRAVTRESGINNLLFFRGQYRGTHWVRFSFDASSIASPDVLVVAREQFRT